MPQPCLSWLREPNCVALRDGITTLSQRCWKAFGPCIVLREAPWPSSTDLTVQGGPLCTLLSAFWVSSEHSTAPDCWNPLRLL